ncbi:bifunctional ADP-dependent NAD(P)H-hydrate dehydratase/NAD(P)H-hydrate epimerase [candidate division LCP-89 bacterium B3_LCP]|uniref:Bifunctional NAD(P)H-hydrate repair enzyme n=1 Tax=candidate division LCP-89 bacterium B3_LCP TaxID=2012998 RepID=A0A532V395_UNCL8|nr:MAG: bifunctional ADP-dependent NAD(P)H-hydrate dehydratase/NAD(P)H-hydrate epimerase [candidate division LCP-89 bacterium B3_LCP]
MKKIATANEMQALDAAAIEKAGIPALILMENASLGLLDVIKQIMNGDFRDQSYIIACGKGNNGGDGYALGRHLLNRGAKVTLLSTCPVSKLQGDARTNAEIYKNIGGIVTELKEANSLRSLPSADLIVDALLGTGITGPPRGLTAKVIDWINGRSEPVLAVDIPSGVEGDTGVAKGSAVIANWTVTMGLLKRGLVLSPGKDLAGEITVAIISLPPRIRAGTHIPFNLLEPEDVRAAFPRRDPAAHKGDCGKAFILAGSPGMTGAATLSARAALRIGAGLVKLGIPAGLNPILETKLTEVMTNPLAENDKGFICPEALPKIEELASWADVLAIGPGLSQHADTGETIKELLKKVQKPVVIDADGLNLLGDEEDFDGLLHAGTILTPHPGEFSRLCGIPIPEILANRVDLTAEKAEAWGTVIVLKGSPTIIADPGGEMYCNPTGNAALATGGSGDVLTGMILGLLAQGCPTVHAACVGVYLHGLAGDIAARDIGIAATIAGDIDHLIPETIRQVIPEA